MPKKYVVTLTDEEREQLVALVTKGKSAARTLTRARILLKTDQSPGGPAWPDQLIQETLDVGLCTVMRVRERFVEEGLAAALRPRKASQTPRTRKLDGYLEAQLVVLACSPAPEGHARWTLRLLADRMVELEYVEDLSYETVRNTLKKNEVKPWLIKEWCLPPAGSGEFVAPLEDVVDVYTQPYDPKRPQVCMDELSRQLIGETRTPVPVAPGQPALYDYEYVRNGVANLFIFFEPLAGRRELRVTTRRTMVDWAEAIRALVDDYYPEAEKIVLVLDNLNTHGIGSLYEAFPPAEARRLARKLEIHYTPKHGSWLNMAESELSILSRQCLSRRIPTLDQLNHEVQAWATRRNRAKRPMQWRFTTADARIRLARLYPSLEA